MSYFKNFNPVYYRFGNEESYALATNLAQYVDLIDKIKTRDLFLQDYTIPANERPDQTSFSIYGNTDFYWTFFLVNDHIRENGWPLTLNEVDEAVKKRYPHRMVTVKIQQPDVIDYYDDDNIPIFRTKLVGTAPDQFQVGAEVTGSQSGTIGKIIQRDLSLGTFVIDTENVVRSSFFEDQSVTPNSNGIVVIERTDVANAETYHSPLLWTLKKDGIVQSGYKVTLDPFNREATISDIAFDPTSTYTLSYYVNTANTTDGKFIVGEELSYTNPAGTRTSMIVFKESAQYNGTHHYEDADGNWVDIDPLTQNTSGATEITYLDFLRAHNESLRQIKFIKPDAIQSIANDFAELMRQ
jgi:hypothetical protein